MGYFFFSVVLRLVLTFGISNLGIRVSLSLHVPLLSLIICSIPLVFYILILPCSVESQRFHYALDLLQTSGILFSVLSVCHPGPSLNFIFSALLEDSG